MAIGFAFLIILFALAVLILIAAVSMFSLIIAGSVIAVAVGALITLCILLIVMDVDDVHNSV